MAKGHLGTLWKMSQWCWQPFGNGPLVSCKDFSYHINIVNWFLKSKTKKDILVFKQLSLFLVQLVYYPPPSTPIFQTIFHTWIQAAFSCSSSPLFSLRLFAPLMLSPQTGGKATNCKGMVYGGGGVGRIYAVVSANNMLFPVMCMFSTKNRFRGIPTSGSRPLRFIWNWKNSL